MKKLLFLTAAIGFAFSVNAQQVQTRVNVPASIERPAERVANEKRAVPFLKESTILKNKAVTKEQKQQKATNEDVEYTFYTWIYNLTFAERETQKTVGGGSADIAPGGAASLFPDSLTVEYHHDVMGVESWQNTSFNSMGFVFDPYSKSFSYFGDEDLFESIDTLWGYRIDSLLFWADYRLAKNDGNNYNPARPDILRFHAWTIDQYAPKANAGTQYAPRTVNFGDSIDPDNRNMIYAFAELADPIVDKGPGVISPKAGSAISWDYPLSLDDTVVVNRPGYIRGTACVVTVPNGGFEVPPGSLVAFSVEFIPGDTNYNLGDTSSKTVFNSFSNTTLTDTTYMNSFKLWYWEVPRADGNIIEEEAIKYWDRLGYNTSLAGTKELRYGIRYEEDGVTSSGAYYPAYDAFYYSPSYYAKPAFQFKLCKGNNFHVISSIIERNELISAIYPNPATSQLTIDLKEEGKATVEIYNVLGQTLIQENVSDMSNTINISNLSHGMYVVKVTQNGKVSTVKFSKQ